MGDEQSAESGWLKYWPVGFGWDEVVDARDAWEVFW